MIKLKPYHQHIDQQLFEGRFAPINEDAKMLDISIKNINKVIDKSSSEKDIESLLTQSWEVSEKLDGTKLTIIRNDQPFDKDNFAKNWIVSYKNSVLYHTEYEKLDRDLIKKESIGTSQYAFVFDHLQKIHHQTKSVPKNTEFFVEFLMNKPTLTRDYKHKHGLVLIGWSPTKYRLMKGIVTSKPKGMNFDTQKWAKILGLNTPKILFEGPLYPYARLIDSGKSEQALSTVDKYNTELSKANDIFEYYNALYSMMLDIPSVYGGKTEGVVFSNKKVTLKILQDDQHDKEVRFQKRMQWKSDKKTENSFYANIHKHAQDIIGGIDKSQSIEDAVKELGDIIYTKGFIGDLGITHPKKTEMQIADDLLLTAKMKLVKLLDGNHGAILVGRFQPPTAAHIGIVEDAFDRYDYVIVGLVQKRGKPTDRHPFDVNTITKIWNKAVPQAEIVSAFTGNITTFIKKSDRNINAVLAGSDRVKSYQKQLKRSPGIKVDEIKRTNKDISATKLRNALLNDDFEEFKKNAHPATYDMYDQLRSEINKIK